MKRGMTKLTIEELKKIIGNEINKTPMMVQKSYCTDCGIVNMKNYMVYAEKKSGILFIAGKCSKCEDEISIEFEESKRFIEKVKEVLLEREKKKESEEKEKNKEIYQFKIELKGLKPPIWRRFQVDSSITFWDMHNIIQEVMGWENYHMYQFRIGRKDYIVDSDDDSDDFIGKNVKKSDEVKLNEIFKEENQNIEYDYDFGDGWEHRIILEKKVEFEKGNSYPLCIAGKRACPPEDVGGVPGYEYFLEVIKNPEHEDYKEMIQYSGKFFDSEYFSVEVTNVMLKGITDD